MKKKSLLFFSVSALCMFLLLSCGGGGGGNGSESPILLNEIEDVDGNKYGTCLVGNQLWMAENLRTISFRDGSWMLTGLYAGFKLVSAGSACCIYTYSQIDGLNSENEVIAAYGRLCNSNAVNDSRGMSVAIIY